MIIKYSVAMDPIVDIIGYYHRSILVQEILQNGERLVRKLSDQ